MATASAGSPLTVALRIRPISEEEIDRGGTITAHAALDQTMVVLLDPSDDPDDILRQNRTREKQYMFDHVFDAIATQEEVYEKTTKDLISWVINGYNATVFAYGATGCGKTYTMLGSEDSPGIMARTLNDLFLEMNKNADNRYQVTMSYFELYNEMIRDLLNPSSGLLDLREDNKGRNVVAGLSEVETASTEDIMAMLVQGNKERTQEPTAANLTSSRSHAILQVSVRQQSRIRDTNTQVKVGRLFLIDLAGSERAAHTKNRGKRMVEGAHINRSLLALGNCINALVEKGPKAYVNYRDSKLTRILKDSLGGNSMTVMIAHISPASQHFEESRNTLLYADRAKNIKNTVKKNVMDVTYHIAQYQSIIGELREEISRLRKKITEQDGVGVGSAGESSSIGGGRSNLHTSSGISIAAMKEQLVDNFREQMELRRKLMETNSQALELSLEQSRHLMLVHDWEGERVVKKKLNPLADHSIDNKDMDEMEKGTLESLALIGSPDEPPEIAMSRDQLKNLNVQRQRLEAEKEALEADLQQCRDKARRLEDSLPGNINSGDHREILSLLCKVHELEIENTESQSAILLKDYEMRKKDMIIERYEHNRMLCDQIIQQQRGLVKEHALPVPEELEELYDLYLQLNDAGEMSAGTPTQLNPTKLQSVATLMKVFGEMEVETLNLRSEPSTLVSEEDSPRHDAVASRRFNIPVVDVDDEAPGTSSSSSSSKPVNKRVDVDKKLFSESAKAKKIFSKKNHQDSAPELLETAAARLSGAGDREKGNAAFKSNSTRTTEARLVSLSDPCSPIASPTEEPNNNNSGSTLGKNLILNKTYDLRGLTPSSRGATGAKPRPLLQLSNEAGNNVDAASPSDGDVKPKTETISMIAARRASRIQRSDGGRLSISVNDLTEVGRANQTASSLSFVSSVATHDGVVRLNTTHQNNRRLEANAAIGANGNAAGNNNNNNNKKNIRERSPEDGGNAGVKSKFHGGRNPPDRKRRVGGAAKNAFESNGGADPNRPWRQQPQQQQQPSNRRIKPSNAPGKIWFPRDHAVGGKDKVEPPQPLQSREAPPATVAQNNAHGNGLTVVRRNRGYNHVAGSSNSSTPSGHQGATTHAGGTNRKRNGRGGINAPAGFTSNRSHQHNNGSNGGNSSNGAGDASGQGIAITGHALRNGDPF